MNPLDSSLDDIIKFQRKPIKNAALTSKVPNGINNSTSNTNYQGKGKATSTRGQQSRSNAPTGQKFMKKTHGREINSVVEGQRLKEVINKLRVRNHQDRNAHLNKSRGLPVENLTTANINKRLRPAGAAPIPKSQLQRFHSQPREIEMVPQAIPTTSLPPPTKAVLFSFENPVALKKQHQGQQITHDHDDTTSNSDTKNNIPTRKKVQSAKKGKPTPKYNVNKKKQQNNSSVVTAPQIHTQPATVIYKQPIQQPVVTYQTVPAHPHMDFQFDTVTYDTPGVHLHPAQVISQPLIHHHQQQLPLPPRPRPVQQQQPVQVVMHTSNGWPRAKIEPVVDYNSTSAYDNATQFMSRMSQIQR